MAEPARVLPEETFDGAEPPEAFEANTRYQYVALLFRLISVKLVIFVPSAVSVLNVLPSVERSIVKPISSAELSAQSSVSELLAGADTVRPEGAAGGSPAAVTVLI